MARYRHADPPEPHEDAELIAQKGGTGKTTLGIHLAVQAQREGLQVLLIDTGPQGSAGAWWQRRASAEPALVQGLGTELAEMQAQARDRGFQLVIVDTAPHSSEQSRACAARSDAVLIPTRPAILDLDAIGRAGRGVVALFPAPAAVQRASDAASVRRLGGVVSRVARFRAPYARSGRRGR